MYTTWSDGISILSYTHRWCNFNFHSLYQFQLIQESNCTSCRLISMSRTTYLPSLMEIQLIYQPIVSPTCGVYCHIHIGDVTSTSTHSTDSNWCRSPRFISLSSLVCPGGLIYKVPESSFASISLETHIHVVHSTHYIRNTVLAYCIIQVCYIDDSKLDQTSFQSLLDVYRHHLPSTDRLSDHSLIWSWFLKNLYTICILLFLL